MDIPLSDFTRRFPSVSSIRTSWARARGLRRNPFAFLGTAVIFGVLLDLFFFSLSRHHNRRPPPPPFGHRNGVDLSGLSVKNSGLDKMPSMYTMEVEELSLQELRTMTSRTKGFFGRDFSLGLEWNNLNSIIEVSLLQAELLNRTLVLPSFVYARSCRYNPTVCAQYAPMVHREEALGTSEGSELPYEQQLGWRIPMSFMFNLTKLREAHSVILVSDYLRLHGMSPVEGEASNGAWARHAYHAHPNIFESDQSKLPSLFIIPSRWSQFPGVTAVDFLSDGMKARGGWTAASEDKKTGGRGHWWADPQSGVFNILKSDITGNRSFLEWDQARRILEANNILIGASDQKLEQLFFANGWEVLHTFKGSTGDVTGAIDASLRVVAPRSSIRGFKDDFVHIDADVVIVEEGVPGQRPIVLPFSSTSAQLRFAHMVAYSLVPIDRVTSLARTLSDRMKALNSGRLWMATHMALKDHGETQTTLDNRIKQRLDVGRQVLRGLRRLSTVNTLVVRPDTSQISLGAPFAGDLFYVSSEEQDPDGLKSIAAAGAVFLNDIITIEDMRTFGWPLVLTDVLSLVDNEVLAHSAYFYGRASSSFSRDVVNRRAARGADPRTMRLD